MAGNHKVEMASLYGGKRPNCFFIVESDHIPLEEMIFVR